MMDFMDKEYHVYEMSKKHCKITDKNAQTDCI